MSRASALLETLNESDDGIALLGFADVTIKGEENELWVDLSKFSDEIKAADAFEAALIKWKKEGKIDDWDEYGVKKYDTEGGKSSPTVLPTSKYRKDKDKVSSYFKVST